MRARYLKTLVSLAGELIAVCSVASPVNAAEIDCPLRDAPYSIDSPLLDLLIKPEARSLIAGAAPEFQKIFDTLSTSPPTFAAIVTLNTLNLPADRLASIDESLRKIPLRAEDRVARCARYDVTPVKITVPLGKPRVLLFQKINGYRHDSVAAAELALKTMAAQKGWALVSTDKAGAITPANLKNFDVVVWNNISGDVLTLTQRRAFVDYIEHGGGFVGFHGSGGDLVWFWDWYADELIGARFEGHPADPQFQDANVRIEPAKNGIAMGLAPGWTMNDEWYSFKRSPRDNGADVIATLDESTYSAKGGRGEDLRMGDDHPIAWTKCVRNGRSFYSALGHRPEAYADPRNVTLLEQGIVWAAGMGRTFCKNGNEVAR